MKINAKARLVATEKSIGDLFNPSILEKERLRALRAGEFNLSQEQWQHKGRGEFIASLAAAELRLVFNKSIVYKNQRNLRDDTKTKYLVYLIIFAKSKSSGRTYSLTIDFVKAIGESSQSNDKVTLGVHKAQEFAKKIFGISLGQFDFSN